MGKKLCTLRVKVDEGSYCFETMVDTKYLKEWREAGIDINELVNTIPVLVANLGLPAIKTWCFFQDMFNFKKPFKE